MTAQLLTGRCHCGAVEFSVKGEVGAFYCHCEDCRLSSATPFVAWGRIHSDSFELIRGSLKNVSLIGKRELVFLQFLWHRYQV